MSRDTNYESYSAIMRIEDADNRVYRTLYTHIYPDPDSYPDPPINNPNNFSALCPDTVPDIITIFVYGGD